MIDNVFFGVAKLGYKNEIFNFLRRNITLFRWELLLKNQESNKFNNFCAVIPVNLP